MAVLCVAGQTFTFSVRLEDQADAGKWKAAPTIGADDFTITINGGAYAPLDNTPTVTPAAGVRVQIVLSAAETTAAGAGGLIDIEAIDDVGAEWYDTSAQVRVVAASGDVAQTGADGDTLETLSDEIAVVDANVDAILLDTGTDGVVVDTFTAGGKAELQAEAQDALEANDLDHLIEVTAGAEKPTDGSYLDQIMNKDGSQTFNASTDSLEAIRDALSSTTITVVSAVDGGLVSMVPYTTWGFTLDGIPDLSDAAVNGVLFTVKRNHSDADADAILQVQEGVGLLVLNGSTTVTANKATLTVGATEDEITVHLNADQTAIPEQDLVWDIKKIIVATDDARQVATGTFHIGDDAITKKLTTV